MQTAHALSPDQTAYAWDAVVDRYEECFEPFTNRFVAEALALVPAQAGTRVLDVASGPGGLALAALDAGAEITAIDLSPQMIDRLRRRLDREQRWRSITLVMDGQNLELPDNLYHSAYSIFGVIFFPDPQQGLREIRRTLRPGGRAVVAAWSHPQRHEALRLVGEVLGAVWPGFRPPAQPPPWLCFQNPETLRDSMLAAGFRAVSVRTVAPAWEMPSAEWFVERVAQISPGTAYLFESMPPAVAERFRDELLRRLHARFGDGPVRFTAEAHLATGSK